MSQDWIELLESLNANQVDYIVVGAFAVAHHGFPRFTGDLDLLFAGNLENSIRLHKALSEFGAPVAGLTPESLSEAGTTLTFGMPPHRIDLINWISGLDWADASSDKVLGHIGPVPVRFLSIRALRKNKLATGRPQDLADLARLPES